MKYTKVIQIIERLLYELQEVEDDEDVDYRDNEAQQEILEELLDRLFAESEQINAN